MTAPLNVQRSNRFATIASILLVLAGLVSGCSDKHSVDKESSAVEMEKSSSFDIGMVTFAGYAPLYIAKEKGFFDNLDVRLNRIEEVATIRAGVAKGDLEAYLATLDIGWIRIRTLRRRRLGDR